ncbi:chemotaxis protein CheW [Ferviditalea candida]|uniref:histidine kinase n=1 Tax=Ferviditalea candida TaxID=3108399 RepID=A0ABU5ZKR3_9BACL|nr:chemotaxis protein CheA [Paenibacillaceae bacterium T2]
MDGRIEPPNVDSWRAFQADWTECLKDLEIQILKLEVQHQDSELIEDLCDRMHRMKRGASYAGFIPVRMIAYEMETAFDAIRGKTMEVRSELIDSLLFAADILSRCANEFTAAEQWNEAAAKLRDIAAVCIRKKENEAVRTGSTLSDSTPKSREQYLYDAYELIDHMINESFMNLDRDENDREALGELIRTVHGLKRVVEGFCSALSTENLHAAAFNEVYHLLERFDILLNLLTDRKQAFTKDRLTLAYEITDYLKSSMESAALENGASTLHADMLEKINDEISFLTALPQSESESGMPYVPPNNEPPESASKSSMPQSIRVNQDKLDKMMNMISELLIAKNAFIHLSAKLNAEYDLPELSKDMKEVGFAVNRISDELQNTIMSIRMIEVKTIFQKMPRIIRDVAQLTGKKMELVMVGENTEIDKTILEQISDPIVHLIRNAADHGIESAEERLGKGKSETGKITLRAYNRDKHVYIEIEDDGKGIDAAVLKRKALERGFISAENADKMSPHQLMHLIFLPGFSTAGQITEVSGRGVGMDIVKSNIEKINGSITIHSEVGKGTKMVIHLPLTLAISRGLIVSAAEETYIFPIDHISETVKINRNDLHEFDGKYFASHKGEVIGIEWLSKLFLLETDMQTNHEELNAVVISNGAEKFGVIVDKLKNEQEFVMKTLNGNLAGIPGISGSTLLGNGQVVLIVNPVDLIQLAKK